MQEDESEDTSWQKEARIVFPSPRPRHSSNFVDMAAYQPSNVNAFFEDTRPMMNSSRRYLFRGMSSASESSAPEALLNVVAFTLTETAMALNESYGECLLGYVANHSTRVTMEDFILMSCVISACGNIAENFDTFKYVGSF
ncbi:unnamed protein product [Peronospora effusa]|nr:unnamed protein product [Peronospora effusa]